MGLNEFLWSFQVVGGVDRQLEGAEGRELEISLGSMCTIKELLLYFISILPILNARATGAALQSGEHARARTSLGSAGTTSIFGQCRYNQRHSSGSSLPVLVASLACDLAGEQPFENYQQNIPTITSPAPYQSVVNRYRVLCHLYGWRHLHRYLYWLLDPRC